MHTTTVTLTTGEIIQIPYTVQEQADWDVKNAAYVADTSKRNAFALRKERNAKLTATDWTQGADVPQAIKDRYASYRQTLRDLPTQSNFPDTVVWPTQPE